MVAACEWLPLPLAVVPSCHRLRSQPYLRSLNAHDAHPELVYFSLPRLATHCLAAPLPQLRCVFREHLRDGLLEFFVTVGRATKVAVVHAHFGERGSDDWQPGAEVFA